LILGDREGQGREPKETGKLVVRNSLPQSREHYKVSGDAIEQKRPYINKGEDYPVSGEKKRGPRVHEVENKGKERVRFAPLRLVVKEGLLP